MVNENFNFGAVLDNLNAQYKDLPTTNRWYPPDQEYLVQIISVGKRGWTEEKTMKPIASWRISAKIINEQRDVALNGREFDIAYAQSDKEFQMGNLLKGSIPVLADKVFDTATQALDWLEANGQGKVLKVNVQTNKGGFKNVTWLKALPARATAPTPAPAPTEPKQ